MSTRRYQAYWNPSRRFLEFRDESGGHTRIPTAGGGGGGGGVTAHTGLTALAWTSSGHTGTASRIAGFDGAGAASVYTVTALLDLLSTTQGVVIYRGAASWSALSPGTAGYVLTSGGAGADPSWQAASGSGLTHAGVKRRLLALGG